MLGIVDQSNFIKGHSMALASVGWVRKLRMTFLQQTLAHLRSLPEAERFGALVCELDTLSPSDWLRLLGASWADLPRIAGCEEFLLNRTPLGSALWPVVEMMEGDELAAFIALPDEFIAYRGTLAHNHAGLCWSLGSAQAAAYAHRSADRWTRFSCARPTTYRLTARVDKSQVIAVKRECNGLTVLAAQVDYLDTEILPVPKFIKVMATDGTCVTTRELVKAS